MFVCGKTHLPPACPTLISLNESKWDSARFRRFLMNISLLRPYVLLSLVKNLQVPLLDIEKKPALSCIDLAIYLVQGFFLPNEEEKKVTLRNFPSPSAGGTLSYTSV